MKKWASCRAVFGALIALVVLLILPLSHSQELRQQQPSQQENSISDKELRAFAKVYVEIEKIRLELEPTLKDLQDPKEIERVRQETESRVEGVLERQGLDAESYKRIFVTVNRDEKLRQKTLALIERERRKS